MRYFLAGLAFAAALACNASAQAEKRVFVIANDADGYGVDRCLAGNESCGVAVATAYCRARDFAEATSFHKVGAEEISGTARSGIESCQGSSCERFVAIECTR